MFVSNVGENWNGIEPSLIVRWSSSLQIKIDELIKSDDVALIQAIICMYQMNPCKRVFSQFVASYHLRIESPYNERKVSISSKKIEEYPSYLD